MSFLSCLDIVINTQPRLLLQGDFYNNCVVGATANVGPREPWHDCHAKVEGPAALDIMKNFEERW
jgi:phospholipase D1/2